MKCENCGKNEVTFVYQSNINGRTEEHHLCSECAQKLGYAQRFSDYNRSMMQRFFQGDSLLEDPFFQNFFSPMPSLMERMNRMLESPFDDGFTSMPALTATTMQENEANRTAQRAQDDLVPPEEQSYFSYLRERNALKAELKKAVHHEEFERAAQLRDQLHQLEEAHKEQKKAQ